MGAKVVLEDGVACFAEWNSIDLSIIPFFHFPILFINDVRGVRGREHPAT